MLNSLSPRSVAFVIAFVFLATIVAAWAFEYAGYEPCDLCLKQRWAYYILTPLAFLLAVLNPRWMKAALMVLGAGLLASAAFGVFHAGVEWKWWDGPSTCAAGGLSGALGGELLPDLSKPSVPCNEAALRIPPLAYGLSLAGWNAVISLALATLALATARR